MKADNKPEITFVAQKDGWRVAKVVHQPKDPFGLEMITWIVKDDMGHVINDNKTIFPRPYFTSEEDALKVMNTKNNIRENQFYKSYQEVIEEDWKSALRRGAVAAGIGGAAALGLNSLHNKPLPTHSPTPSNHISVSTPKRVSAADIDAKLKAQRPTQPEVKSLTPAPKPSTKDSNRAELRTIDIIINIIMSHEGLEPKQTPVRITSRKMRNWDHVLGFDIDKNYQRDPARGNFFYLQDASKVDDLIKKIFRLYSIYPQKYGLPRKPTLKQCIHKFDQTGAKGKIAYLKKKLPTLNIDTPMENFFL